MEAGSPFHLGMDMEWRYMAKTVHVIKDHVSFGSQPQYLPHASFAHAAPENMPNVNNGNPNNASRKDVV